MWLEQLPSGKWRGGYRDGAGRKRQKSFMHKTAAREWARDGEDAVARGRDPFAGRLLVRDWVERWKAARVVSTVTEYNQRSHLAAIVARFGDVPLDAMSTLEVQSWVKQLVAGGLGSNTARLYAGTLNGILDAAVRERLLPENPARFVTLPRTTPGREVYLTPAEVAAVADVMTPAPYDVACRLLPYLGLRWGEIAGLRVGDVDTLRRTAQVRQVVVQIAGELTVRPYGKTASSLRTVPVPPAQVEVIAAYLAANPRGRDELLFVDDAGRPLSRHRMSRSFKAALDAAGVRKAARPHDLRHSGASWLAQAGVPIFAISKWLGHSSLQTTMRYAHAAEDGSHADVARVMTSLSRGTDRGTTGVGDS